MMGLGIADCGLFWVLGVVGWVGDGGAEACAEKCEALY